MGKRFLQLVGKHFPKHHKFRTPWKVSYSCLTNIKSKIGKHNRKVLATTPQNPTQNVKTCSCPRKTPFQWMENVWKKTFYTTLGSRAICPITMRRSIREYAQQHGKSATETTGRHSETITMKKILHYLRATVLTIWTAAANLNPCLHGWCTRTIRTWRNGARVLRSGISVL